MPLKFERRQAEVKVCRDRSVRADRSRSFLLASEFLENPPHFVELEIIPLPVTSLSIYLFVCFSCAESVFPGCNTRRHELCELCTQINKETNKSAVNPQWRAAPLLPAKTSARGKEKKKKKIEVWDNKNRERTCFIVSYSTDANCTLACRRHNPAPAPIKRRNK